MAPPDDERSRLLKEVEWFLQATGMSASRFGTEAVNDPSLVLGLRRGRECKRATRLKIRKFIHSWRQPRRRTMEAAA